jgi:Cu-Zn family superoxide dismutase
VGGNTRVVLDVTLLQPDGGPSANRPYGAHVHVAKCNQMQAGGHYRNDPDAGASATNELWLDFTTNAAGMGTADHTAGWLVRPGAANAVVIHANSTDAMGVAGSKLVCVDVNF